MGEEYHQPVSQPWVQPALPHLDSSVQPHIQVEYSPPLLAPVPSLLPVLVLALLGSPSYVSSHSWPHCSTWQTLLGLHSLEPPHSFIHNLCYQLTWAQLLCLRQVILVLMEHGFPQQGQHTCNWIYICPVKG